MPRYLLIPVLALLIAACQPADQPETPTLVDEPPTVGETIAERPDDRDCQLSMGWDPWEPYHFSGVGGQVQGLDIDLVSAAAERVGCELTFVQGNWASLLQLIRLGELDLLPGASHTPEREEFAWFSDPYRHERFELYVRAIETSEWQGESVENLLENGMRIGITQGYIYGDVIDSLQGDDRYAENFIEASVGELNFTRLMDHRIDGFVEDPFVASTIQRRRSWGTDIEALPFDLGGGEVHLLFSHASTSAELAAAFNQALADMRSESEYDAIMARYLD
jgi:polar amino acid transport system substrate-binding protein